MFDPMHNGHLDLIERSTRIFDELIVAVVANPSKQPLFDVKERLEMIDEATTGMGRIRITSFDGLLIDLVHREQADCIIRGIRAVSDFEYEFQMALMNRKLRHTVETVFLMPHERYTYISSRLIKEVASLGAAVTGMVPPVVEERLNAKFSSPLPYSPCRPGPRPCARRGSTSSPSGRESRISTLRAVSRTRPSRPWKRGRPSTRRSGAFPSCARPSATSSGAISGSSTRPTRSPFPAAPSTRCSTSSCRW